MSHPGVTVVVPTLAADAALVECLRSLEHQTYPSYDVIVVDNSGCGKVRALNLEGAFRVIENDRNVGFGAAINQGWRASSADFIATLNDDAVADPQWLAALIDAADERVGMVASCVMLGSTGRMDSAGMVICGDASSKQRAHDCAPEHLSAPVLCPSGSAALYRGRMLAETGGFDEDFFLYCEDTDLGLRAQWLGWSCVYEPRAVVHHRYSHSAGRASALKAYYVERNRLWLLMKNFPLRLLWRAPFVSAARYFWHLALMLRGEGRASEFGGGGAMLAWFVLRAHLSTVLRLPQIIRQRRATMRTARTTATEFEALLARHRITAREVAAH